MCVHYLETIITRAMVRSNAVLPLHDQLREQGALHVHVVKKVASHPNKEPCLLSLLIIHVLQHTRNTFIHHLKGKYIVFTCSVHVLYIP